MGTDWFSTTPEAVLRAESVLTAFREGREHDIETILTQDQDGTTEPLHLLVALICITDRVTDYAEHLAQTHAYQDDTVATITRRAAQTVAEAYYSKINGTGGGHPSEQGYAPAHRLPHLPTPYTGHLAGAHTVPVRTPATTPPRPRQPQATTRKD